MARFSALLSDSSDDDASHLPGAKPVSLPVHRDFPLDANRGDDAADEASSSCGSSHMDEAEFLKSPPRRRRRDRKVLVEGPDGEYYHPHELEHTDEDNSASSSGSSPEETSAVRSRDSSAIPWAQQAGNDVQKLHVMQASLFRAPEEAEALRQFGSAGPSTKPFSLSPTRLATQVQRKALERSPSEGPDTSRRDLVPEALLSLDILATDVRLSRTYSRVEAASSFVAGAESAFVDAGLAFGRSFRVGWGPGGSIVHVGRICGVYSDLRISANTSIVTRRLIPILQSTGDAGILSTKLLSLHLSRSPISYDADGVPSACPTRDLHFAAFTELFPAAEQSFEASLFRLGHALFDELDLRLHGSVDADVRNRAHAVRRKAALSSWLEDAVAPAVDAELKGDVNITSTPRIFTLLTGHQIERACEVALEDGNVRLATLISQAGGDAEYQDHLLRQLHIWQQQRVNGFIDDDLRKIYNLLAGRVGATQASSRCGDEECPDMTLTQGLDWKRALGLHLWFAQPLDASIAQVFGEYERHRQEVPEQSTTPLPHYHELLSPVPSLWNPPQSDVFDALYNIIQLYSDPSLTLSSLLDPRSFTQSPADYTLPWHLYILLSRCMHIRDFADRDNPPGITDREGDCEGISLVEGHSPSADLLTSSYAHQLEGLGLIQEAAFVLLHIESSTGRENAIKDLLARSAPRLDDWMTRGLAGSLKIPLAWVNEAMATYHLSNGSIFEAHQLYLQGGLYGLAHELAVLELAPEAVVRDDMILLQSLFDRIDGHPVDGWHVRGKVFLDYATLMFKLPGLRAQVQNADPVPDASDVGTLNELVRNIPKLLGVLPELLRDRQDPRHCAAVAEMTTNLTRELDLARPLLLSPNQLRIMVADEGTKLRHLQAVATDRFLSLLR